MGVRQITGDFQIQNKKLKTNHIQCNIALKEVQLFALLSVVLPTKIKMDMKTSAPSDDVIVYSDKLFVQIRFDMGNF